MRMMKKNKEFDAVAMMRTIRNRHHLEYVENPELREKRLAIIREKYKDKIRTNTSVKS